MSRADRYPQSPQFPQDDDYGSPHAQDDRFVEPPPEVQDARIEARIGREAVLKETLRQTEARLARLEKKLAAVIAAAESAHDAVLDFVDVKDGADGEPVPNWAMSLVEELERALGMVEGGR